MKNILLIFIAALLSSCNSSTKTEPEMEGQNNSAEKQPTAIDTTPKVTGIGGIFFFSEDPKKAREWYAENLGLAVNQYGSSFEFRNAHRPEEINYLQWSPFKQGSDYMAPSKRNL